MTPLQELRLACDIHNFGGPEKYLKWIPLIESMSEYVQSIESFETAENFVDTVIRFARMHGIAQRTIDSRQIDCLADMLYSRCGHRCHDVMKNSCKRWN